MGPVNSVHLVHSVNALGKTLQYMHTWLSSLSALVCLFVYLFVWDRVIVIQKLSLALQSSMY